jgi:hypothetical protein
MKKTTLKKLELHRETLVPLQANQLDDINGGTWGHVVRTVVAATKNVCPTLVTTVASQPIITCRGQ